MTSATPPQNLKADLKSKKLEVIWSEADRLVIPFRSLRGLCPCAACVNEFTGERTFHADDAATDVHPLKFDPIGNYAVRISWSDQHNTGLYTWEYLKLVQQELEARP